MLQREASRGSTSDVSWAGPSPLRQYFMRRAMRYSLRLGDMAARDGDIGDRECESAGTGAVDSLLDAVHYLRSPGIFADGRRLVTWIAIWTAADLDNNDGPTSEVGIQVVRSVLYVLYTLVMFGCCPLLAISKLPNKLLTLSPMAVVRLTPTSA